MSDDTPAADPSDPPFYTVKYNKDWRPLVLFALSLLMREQWWEEGDNDAITDLNSIERLIERFAGVEVEEIDIDLTDELEGLTLIGGTHDTVNGWVIGAGGASVELRYTAAAGRTLVYAEMEFYSPRPSGVQGNIRYYDPQTDLAQPPNQGVGWHSMNSGAVSVSVSNYVRFAVNNDATFPNENKITRVIMHFLPE